MVYNIALQARWNGQPFSIDVTYYMDENICVDWETAYDFNSLSESDQVAIAEEDEWLMFSLIDGGMTSDRKTVTDSDDRFLGTYEFNICEEI